MAVWFISDLHLDADRPAATRLFLECARDAARRASALYILGDLFEAWIGDDDDAPAHVPVLDALAELTAAGVPCYFQRGNRDFLVGDAFAARTGCTLLGDYADVDLFGERVLLTHGDLLCTDDTRYLTLRAQLRDARWQDVFLGKPLPERRRIADQLRRQSQTETAAKEERIMDVNSDTVTATMRKHGVWRLLHGHTHRPNVHRFSLDGHEAVRIVLGAWYAGGSIVRWDENGFALEALP